MKERYDFSKGKRGRVGPVRDTGKASNSQNHRVHGFAIHLRY
jgi:hypothetical protein